MTKDDALRMMLGPFKAWRDVPGNEDVAEELTKIITAVEKVLAQPEQEPRAWLVEFENGEEELHFDEQSVGEIHTPLYTHSPQRKPLTNGEIYTAYITATNQALRPQDERIVFGFARAIEAAHGIKENI